jgi:hypothetical protein
MIILDTFIEWLVIVIGFLMALGVLFPGTASKLMASIQKAIPHPSEVNELLKRFGL